MNMRLLPIAAALLTTSAALAGSEPHRLVRVATPDKADVQTLVDHGYDVWESSTTSTLVRATDKRLEDLADLRLTYQVQFESDEAYRATLAHQAEFALPDAGAFHTYSETTSAMQALVTAHPDICEMFSIGTSVEGRNLWMLKISDNVAADEDEPEIIFTGCHHAREWISVEIPLYAAQQLVNGYATNDELTRYVSGAEIFIIPMLNPDGHEYTVSTDRYWRKNRRNNGDGTYGVDLNRNYGYQWGPSSGSSGFTDDDTYRGPTAFSEPETRAVRDFTTSHHITGDICFHSYSQLILSPWGYTTANPPNNASYGLRGSAMASAILSSHGMTYTSEHASGLYIANGVSTDWFQGNSSVCAYTIEVRPTSAAGGGFELPEAQIVPTCEENFAAMKKFLGFFVLTTSGNNWEVR